VEACTAAWRAVLERAVTLAAVEASLWRLSDEFRRTERRTAAIEHVLLPELDAAIGTIEQALEGVEQEEALRVRRVRGSAAPDPRPVSA
jgi:vacuolar-type H+-ATPase subunit D/Vma8